MYLELKWHLFGSLQVNQNVMKHDSVFGDASHLRQIPGHKHDRLRKVQINGFCSAKSMVELACHILENAPLLESLTVDTIVDSHSDGDVSRCSVRKKGRCKRVARNMVMEARGGATLTKGGALAPGFEACFC